MPNPLIRTEEIERRLLVQYAVSRALAESETAEVALSRVLEEIGTNLGWRAGTVWLVDEQANRLHPAAIWRADPTLDEFVAATTASRFAPGEGLPGHVWRTGVAEWHTDIANSTNFPRLGVAAPHGLHAAFAFPVSSVRAQTPVLLGVIELFSDHAEPPDEGLLHVAAGLGLQIGAFIERRRAQEMEQASRLRNAAVVEVALDCIVTIDRAGQILEWNPAAVRTFGYSREEVLGKQMGELIVPPKWRVAHYEGMRRYLETGVPHVLGRRIEIEAMRRDGTVFPCELAITRVPISGSPVFTAYIRDLSERRRLELAQHLLLRASALLSSSLDYEETLRTLSDVVVPDFADWYAVDILNEDRSLERIALVHRDPAKTKLAQELAQRFPDDQQATRGPAQVTRSGRSEYMREIDESMLTAAARSEEHLRILRELGLRSYMIVPLRAREIVFGAITLVTAESGRRYDESDLRIAEELGARAGQAIENARLFRDVAETRELLEQQATELETQASELEHSATELEVSNEELRHANEQLAKRTEEAERARADAEEARREADAANRAKSDFLASMSHELRTPLNAIMGYAQLLDVGVRGEVSNAQHEDLKRIERSSQHLLSLINDILNYAKVERGHVDFTIERVRLADVLNGVEDLIGPQARAKRLTYQFSNACPDAVVCADRDKLMQIFVNLLSNAIRYTNEGGRIDVSCGISEDKVLTRVRDTGVGIPADRLDDIFEPFVQIDREYAGQRQGTGLGLAISRELARRMGGDITVTSTPGEGSEFTLVLERA